MDDIFISAFQQNSVFKDEMKVVHKLISGITPFMQRPDDVVIWIDEEPNNFYFIAEGQCQVSILNHMGKEVNVEPALEQGAFFGELAILFNCKRTATVRSNNYCTFAQINKNIFKRQCSHFITKIKNHTIHYQDMLKKFKIKLLKQVEYFETYETESNPMFFEEI